MNVASLELCKELYELSEWGLHELEYVWRLHLPNGAHELQHTLSWEVDSDRFTNHPGAQRFREENYFFPAYDLGYLLRKLPFRPSGPYYRTTGTFNLRRIAGNKWECGYPKMWWKADTPEDAVCKLAIELHKRALLTKER